MTPPGQPALYDTIGRDYGTTRRADPGIAATVRRLLDLHATGRYLDLGCGAGHYTGALAMYGGSWTGIDVSERMLAAARRAHLDIDWRLADAERLPFADCTFDGAMATLVIHHLKALRSCMREAWRVLQRGRFVIFTAFPEQMQHYWLHHYFPRMIERSAKAMPSETALREALHGAGFPRVDVIPYQVTAELQDLFLYSGKQRPELYLDAAVRANISSFSTLCEESELAAGLQALAADIGAGAIDRIIHSYNAPGGDYAFVVADTGKTS